MEPARDDREAVRVHFSVRASIARVSDSIAGVAMSIAGVFTPSAGVFASFATVPGSFQDTRTPIAQVPSARAACRTTPDSDGTLLLFTRRCSRNIVDRSDIDCLSIGQQFQTSDA